MPLKPWLLHPHLRKQESWRGKEAYEQPEACAAAERLVPFPAEWKPGFNPDQAGTSVVGDTKFPAWRRCSVVHDHDYTRPLVKSLRDADNEFLGCLRCVIPHEPRAWKRKQMWIAYYWRKAAIKSLSWLWWAT